jgi:CelD/BcsL family acetyltransferase involved in cellulose biosynthesis
MMIADVRPARADLAEASRPGIEVPARQDRGTLLVDLVEAPDLSSIAAAWADLAARAIESNPLHAQAFAAAAITHLADTRSVDVAAIWRIEPSRTRLVGVVPFAKAPLRWGAPARLVVAMSHNYGPLGVPLLDRDHASAAADSFFDWIRRRPVGARFLILQHLTEEGPCAAVLRAVLAGRDLRHRAFGRFRRALALPRRPGPTSGGRYLDHALDAKKRRDLARQWRQLQGLGRVDRAVLTEPGEVGGAVEAFLSLEKAGWKGRTGTASLQRPDRAAFVRAATRDMAACGQARVHRLSLDGEPIAVGIAFVARDRACFWKIAYDERFARYSPGVQLTMAVTDDLLAQPDVTAIDSLADADHPMIDHLWRERLAMVDWLVDLTPGGSWLMSYAATMEGARRSGRDLVRSLLKRIRGR